MRGLLVVNKAKGWTSFDVVNYCKHALHTREVGHLGTLDPMATGVLVVTIGSATKLFDMFLNKTKKYIAKFEFGYSTDTLDADGKIEYALKGSNLSEIEANLTKLASCSTTARNCENHSNSVGENILAVKSENLTNISGLQNADNEVVPQFIDGQCGYPTLEQISSILPTFIGEIEQLPPKYSAKKIQGKKACDLARAGKQVELKPAKVNIKSLKILDYSNKILTLEIECGAGTYIRSLGRDIALKLNSLATMIELTRTEVGVFKLENSINIKQDGIRLEDYILPIDSVFNNLSTLDNVEDVKRLLNGQTLIRPLKDGEYKMYLDGQFIGIAVSKAEHIKMNKYFKL